MKFPIPVTVVLALSIVIQAAAAIMAFRLIKITGRRTAWGFITAALTLMAARRAIPLYRLLTGDLTAPPDFVVEAVGLLLSIAMTIGIAWIAPLFLERKRTEEELRESEQRYKEIFNNASDSMYLLEVTEDGRFRTIDVNPALAKSTGVPLEEAIGKYVDEIKPEAASRAVAAMYRRCLEAGTATTEEAELDLPTGRRFYSSSFVPLRNANGRIHRMVVISRDVTESKRAERERLANLRFFESMDKVNRAIQGARELDNMMHDVLDAALSIFDCDRAWLVYPCDPEAASYRVPMERTKPEYPGALSKGIEIPIDAEMARIFKTAMASDDPVTFGPGSESRLPEALTTQFYVQSQIVMTVYPRIGKPYVFGLHQCSYQRVWTLEEKRIFQEIGRRLTDGLTGMLAYRDLRESEGKLEEAQRIAHIGHWYRDLDAGRVTLSEQACLIFGWSPSERVLSLAQWHDRWQELIRPEDRLKAAEAFAAMQDSRRYDVEYRVARPDGEERIVHSHGEVTRDESGRPCRMFGTIQDITERKHAEDALSRAAEEIRDLYNHAPCGYHSLDKNGVFVRMNDTELEWLGYQREEVIGKMKFADILTAGSLKSFEENFPRFKAAGVIRDLEFELIRKDGSLLPALISATALTDNNGNYLMSRSTVYDITDRKRAEESLYEAQQVFRTLVENSPDIIARYDRDCRRTYVNPTYLREAQIPKQELLATDPLRRSPLPADGAAILQNLLHRVLDSGMAEAVDVVWPKADNIECWYNIYAFPEFDREGQVVSVMTISRDITERKRVEAVLRERETFIKNILETVDEGFIVVDRNYRILSANKSYCSQVGLSAEEVIGRLCFELTHHIDRPCYEAGDDCAVKRTFETGAPFTMSHIHFDRFGAKKYVEIKSYPVVDASGSVSTAIETISDVTERKELEEQLRHAQKLEALGTLAGGVAHDFNNILSVLVGYGALMEMRMAKDDPNLPYLREIRSATDRAAHLTQALLIFGRKQIAELKPLDINELVNGMKKMVLRLIGEDIDTNIDLTDGKLPVMGDYGQLEQVLMNFATNARDAMPDGGTLTLATERLEVDGEFMHRHGFGKSGDFALITVTDTGQGMDEHTRERIFEPFFTTKEVGKGTGLGLSIVYGIVRQHNGYINCYSERDKGTTFKVYLPLLKEESLETEKAAPVALQGGTETLLIADDDPNVRNMNKELLEKYGYTVIEAKDGMDAVNTFRENKERIQLMLLDVIMPKKSGKEVYEEVRALRPGVKAIFVSGYADDVIQRKRIVEEHLALLQKPVSPRDLLVKIREMLDGN